ncbi:peroxisomal succinyl-coenzyme A thioesterase-like isoform X1 [Vulpes lagopus]|uniref:peroxisomal succinyl-coenzyme A thioesterase-like isoform X1 n=1 Tax=Vulpes lagopus TaxID=494514 RepID=UPI001BC91F41|nr:peroxisomal succinyl-coenzyme A thioesterase-like isoform X1 [Vulpes lagopus]
MVASAGAILRASGLRRWGSLPRTPKLWAGARGSATVSLEPAGRCAWDEPVRISVRGLGPGQPVTLRASLRDERGALFRAHARYRADDRGLLDLARAPALGGSFVGLEPMGLLWALEPETPLVRLVKRDVQTPFAVELEVLDGHEPDAGRLLGRALHERHFLRPGVRRVPVRVGRVRGTLFLPPEPGPFPGIVDIYGVGSGLLEYRASLLAGKGFAVMALAYHNYEDLPKGLEILHLEYFEEAVNYLLDHPQVKGPGVGLLGTSKGGPGPFPGIIDIFGIGGGLVEYRASLLAGHGFATLALAYYNFEDLPKEIDNVDLDYFEEALCYMLQHSEVKGPGIGLLGISLGADICLSMASFLKNISATVSINGSGFTGNKGIRYKQTFIPPLGHDLRRIKVAFSGILDIVDIRNDVVGGHENPSMIPMEKAQGPILFIVGQDDHNWRSELYAQIASERLQAHGKEKPQIISYPGTGHYIEPPYFPLCPASIHKLLNKPVIWGGEPRAHSKAQEDAWKQILTFFCKHLGGTQNIAPPKL